MFGHSTWMARMQKGCFIDGDPAGGNGGPAPEGDVSEIPEDEGVDIPEPDEGEFDDLSGLDDDDPEPPEDDNPNPDDKPEKPEVKPDEKMVPLSALEAERKKWQQRLNSPEIAKAKAIADRLKATTGKDYDAIQADLDQLQVQNYVTNGVDPQMATFLVNQDRQMKELARGLNKQKRDIEVGELKANPLYKNLELYRDEVEAHADTTGLSMKAAYLDLYGDTLFTDMSREIEQRVLNSQAKKQAKRIDTSPSGEVKAQPKVNLSADEMAIAKIAGMTPQEYAALKKIQSPDQYRKITAKNK